MKGTALVLGWIGSSVLGEIGSVLVAGASFPDPLLGTAVVVLVEAALLAVLQALLLRSVGRKLALRWIAATVIGTFVGRLLQGVAPPLLPVAVVGALVGLVMAAPQTAVLRGYVSGSGAWLAVRAVAWSVAMPILLVAGNTLASIPGLPLTAAMAGIVLLFGGVGALVGIAEGICIARLLAHCRLQPRPATRPLEPAPG